jgi:Phosphotransferase enzyme family
MDGRSSVVAKLHRLRRRVGLDRSILPSVVNRLIDRRRLAAGMVRGLPKGLDHASLAVAVRDQKGSDFTAVRHAPLQAWKLESANIVWIRLQDGTRWSLVFKNAQFDHDDYPAIRGLSFQVGVPEYSVYSTMTPRLRHFSPEIYAAWELQHGTRYQYIMEDLRTGFHPVYGRRDKASVLRNVISLHDALSNWVAEKGDEHLLRYDRDYVVELIHHAEVGLDRLAVTGGQSITEDVRRVWPDVVGYLLAERNLARRQLRPIHGDLNTKNCFVSNKHGDEVRFVDWEWCGYGTMHDDVASLLKRSDRGLDEQALHMISQVEPHLPERDHLELIWWSRLATAVRDASLLSHQLAGLEDPPAVVAGRAMGLWGSLIKKHARFREALMKPRSLD